MILAVTALYDAKAASWHIPMFTRTPAIAERWFITQLADDTTDIHKWASDFTLFELGTFDDDNAKFDFLTSPRPLIHGLEMRRLLQQQIQN